MQVRCSKCSRAIAVTDIVESSDGQLSHADCTRPQGLTAEERALLFVFCSDHTAAECVTCKQSFRVIQLGSDMLGGRTNLCPQCRTDLTESVRAHLFSCVTLPSEIRRRAQEVREAARLLIKKSHELSDKADVLTREAEVHLFQCQRALRKAMASRATLPN
jgi:hypothetical protein